MEPPADDRREVFLSLLSAAAIASRFRSFYVFSLKKNNCPQKRRYSFRWSTPLPPAPGASAAIRNLATRPFDNVHYRRLMVVIAQRPIPALFRLIIISGFFQPARLTLLIVLAIIDICFFTSPSTF